MQDIRNIAIIAHVDHGKTTLVDKILHQVNTFRDNEESGDLILDNNALERERGITILSKNVSVRYKGTKINIIDTPGHSDFGGEVERVLNMADGCLLLVDAFEGPMPQTRFVLEKAIQLNLKPIVIVNKVDKPNCDPENANEAVFDLMCNLNATEDQLNFKTIYGSSKQGWMGPDWKNPTTDFTYLLDTILSEIPAPKVVEVSLSKDLSEDEAERRFSYLAQIVDSKGWATRGAMSSHGPEISNGLNPDIYFEANSSIDILSDEYSIGQSIDQRLEQSAIQRKQDVLKNIQSPTQYPAITEQPVDKLVYPNIQDNYTVPALETPLINTVEKPIGNVVINPFPTMNQAVLSPTSTTQTSIDINKTIVKEVETENKDIQNTISADIIELATNAPEDFSIATLASQAKRISEEKNNLGEDEVIISLR